MKIDAHQHFWQYDPIRDAWISGEMESIKRDFMPEDLKPLLDSHGIDGCIAVQADQSENETDFLLALAAENDWIKGVVGWVDLLGPDLNERLEYYQAFPDFKGVRHILQAEPDGFMTNPQFVKAIGTIGKFDLTYDILTTENQLNELLELLPQLPPMRLVIDHISKPDIKNGSFDHWASAMMKISQFEKVHVKLSGLVTEAEWDKWEVNDLEPYIDFCLDTFGAERLMYGSDWPVCLLAGSYSQIHKALLECISKLSSAEQELILGGAATKFYNLS